MRKRIERATFYRKNKSCRNRQRGGIEGRLKKIACRAGMPFITEISCGRMIMSTIAKAEVKSLAENPGTASTVANYFLTALFAAAAVWVFFDTRRRGRPLSESIAWALFMGVMFPLAIMVYIFFRRKKLL